MTSKKLHVLMPTYNRRHMLERTLSQLSAQDADPDLWQLTVVDNASTDDTTALLRNYVDALPNFDYVVNDRNLGLFGNLNRCMDLASTDRYLIVHSDDDVDSTLVSSVIDFNERHPEVHMAFGRCRARFEDTGEIIPYWFNSRVLGEQERILDHHELLMTLLGSTSNPIFAPTVVYDRNFFTPNLRYSESYKFTSDLDLWFRAGLLDPRVAYIPEPKITCRIHSGRLSSKNATEMRLEAIKIFRHYMRILRQNRGSDSARLSPGLAFLIKLKLMIFEMAIRLHLIPSFKVRRAILYALER